MKRILMGSVGILSLLLLPALASAGGNANFVLGGRGLDSDFWGPNDGQGSFGVNVDFGKEKWPVSIALGAHGSFARSDVKELFDDSFDFGDFDKFGDLSDFDGLEGFNRTDFNRFDLDNIDFNSDVDGSVSEFSTGVLWRRKGDRRTIPYVGGGVTWVSARQEISGPFLTVSDSDFSPGAYINGGVFWRLGKRFNIGIDARVVAGTDIELFDQEGDADYGQVGLILGWGW